MGWSLSFQHANFPIHGVYTAYGHYSNLTDVPVSDNLYTCLPLCLLAFDASGEANLSQSFTASTGRAPLFRYLRSL